MTHVHQRPPTGHHGAHFTPESLCSLHCTVSPVSRSWDICGGRRWASGADGGGGRRTASGTDGCGGGGGGGGGYCVPNCVARVGHEPR